MIEPDPVRLQEDPEIHAKHGPDDRPDAGETSQPLPQDSLDINVEGREPTAPDDGFGQLWRKRHRVRLLGANVSPEEVIRVWRERFGEFWPEGNEFYRPLTGLEPGEVALIDLEMPSGSRLSTGIIVVDVKPTSFTFVTPQGHTFAGYVTFSSYYDEAGTTIAQVEILMRASDPFFELGLPIGGHKREDQFWEGTLSKLAAHFGVDEEPEMLVLRLDSRRKWRNAVNIVHNSYLHTAFYMATRPLRRLIGKLIGQGRTS